MSDIDNIDWERWRAVCIAPAALDKEALALNKPVLFEALEKAGIRRVTVGFDGAGDSGQIESLDAYDAANGTTAVPNTRVDMRFAKDDGSGLDTRSMPMREAIETIVYALLEASHGGWEINDGSYGEFSFDVAAQSITLDYHERFTDEAHSTHTF